MDDNPTDVFLIQEALVAHNLHPSLIVIEDGEEAMNFIRGIDAGPDAVCPCLILLDINLPRTSGLDVLQAIRNSERCSATPVIVMTSSAADSDRTVASALRADAYFQKPTDYDAFLELGALIRKLM